LPGFWPGCPSHIFFLNRNDVVLVKKKQKSTVCNCIFNRVLPGHLVNPLGQPSHTKFFFPVFSLTWFDSSPKLISFQVDLLGRPWFKSMLHTATAQLFLKKYAPNTIISWYAMSCPLCLCLTCQFRVELMLHKDWIDYLSVRKNKKRRKRTSLYLWYWTS